MLSYRLTQPLAFSIAGIINPSGTTAVAILGHTACRPRQPDSHLFAIAGSADRGVVLLASGIALLLTRYFILMLYVRCKILPKLYTTCSH